LFIRRLKNFIGRMQRIESPFTSASVEGSPRLRFLNKKMSGVKFKIDMIIFGETIDCQGRGIPDSPDLGYVARSRRPSSPVGVMPP
jgi:hypothetical protein